MNQSEYEVGKEKQKSKKKNKDVRRVKCTEFEFADDAISLNESLDERPASSASIRSTHSLKETSFVEDPYTTVNGKEELPCIHEIKKYSSISNVSYSPKKIYKTEEKNNFNSITDKIHTPSLNSNINVKNIDGNFNKVNVNKIYSYCTLPKRKNNSNNYKTRCNQIPPKRVTPDGTHIYYWCDLNKKVKNGKT